MVSHVKSRLTKKQDPAMPCLQVTDFKYKIIDTLKEKDRKRHIMKTRQKEPENFILMSK